MKKPHGSMLYFFPTKISQFFWMDFLYEAVWFKLKAASTFNVFRVFFFPCARTVISHGFTVQGTKITVHSTIHALKNIKNGSYDTIHTFKNYFTTVLSIFSFQFLVSVIISSIQMNLYIHHTYKIL